MEYAVVLTKSELVAALKSEASVLLHLIGKVDRKQREYRPTPKQRSTSELIKYMSMMGPEVVRVAKDGAFDETRWMAAEKAAAENTLDHASKTIATHEKTYETLLADLSDADLRTEMEAFGEKATRGAFLVKWALCGSAAYRMQLFLYLKASGREELNSANLWSGVDAAATV